MSQINSNIKDDFQVVFFLGHPVGREFPSEVAQIPKSENYRLELKFPVAKRFLFCFSFTGKKPSVG